MKNKILDEDEIKRLYLEEFLTMREIAEIIGVSTYPICSIIKGMGISRKNIVIRDAKKYILGRINKDENGCWNYPYSVQSNGYARINNKKAHRVSYEAFVDKIPENMTIDHLCKNKICVNPEHLEVVTIRENILRSDCVSAVNARKTHCIRGHELDGDNLVIYAGKRQCRICLNKAQLRRYHERQNKKKAS